MHVLHFLLDDFLLVTLPPMARAYHQLQSKDFTKLLVNFAKCKCPLHFTSTNIQDTYTVISVWLQNFQDSYGSKLTRFLDQINITSVLKNGYTFVTDIDEKINVSIDPDVFEKTKIFDIFSCTVVLQCNGKKTNVLGRSEK